MTILVVTSVWVDHLSAGVPALATLLDHGDVAIHPFVLGEVALGNLTQRHLILSSLAALPQATVASDAEVRLFIENARLYGQGVGYVDAHLLASARLMPGAAIWTRDKRLRSSAELMGLACGQDR